MITIAKAHYDKLQQVIKLLASNALITYPSTVGTYVLELQLINEKINTIYERLAHDLSEIIQSNIELKNQKLYLKQEIQQLEEKIVTLKSQNQNLILANVQQRGELAKSLSEVNKFKEGIKHLKEGMRQKIKQKDEEIEELSMKVKKYKKISQEQNKKVEKLDKKLSCFEITQKSTAKGKEYDEQIFMLEAQLNELTSLPANPSAFQE